MTPFEVTVLSVTLNAAGIVPSANNRFPPPNVIGNIFSQNASTKSCLMSVWQFPFLRAHRALHSHFLAAASLRSIIPPAPFPLAIEKAPGIPVALKHWFHHPPRVRTELDRGSIAHGFHRNDIPDAFGHHVSHHEIDIVEGVGAAIRPGSLDGIAAMVGVGRLHLYPQQPPAKIHGCVVRAASPQGSKTPKPSCVARARNAAS